MTETSNEINTEFQDLQYKVVVKLKGFSYAESGNIFSHKFYALVETPDGEEVLLLISAYAFRTLAELVMHKELTLCLTYRKSDIKIKNDYTSSESPMYLPLNHFNIYSFQYRTEYRDITN